jgi:hypothetical protein
MRMKSNDQLQRDQRHDVRNAILVVEGAASTLSRYYDRLAEDEREQLREMLGTGFGQLATMVNDGGVPAPANGFVLADALRPVISELQARGVDVAPSIPPNLRAAGAPNELADVVRRLCELAVNESSSPLTVTGGRSATGPQVRIAFARDLDAGSRGGQRRWRLRRLPESSRAAASVPFRVAQRLLHARGGDLEVALRGDEMAFLLTLAPVGEDAARHRSERDGRAAERADADGDA